MTYTHREFRVYHRVGVSKWWRIRVQRLTARGGGYYDGIYFCLFKNEFWIRLKHKEIIKGEK